MVGGHYGVYIYKQYTSINMEIQIWKYKDCDWFFLKNFCKYCCQQNAPCATFSLAFFYPKRLQILYFHMVYFFYTTCLQITKNNFMQNTCKVQNSNAIQLLSSFIKNVIFDSTQLNWTKERNISSALKDERKKESLTNKKIKN